MKTTVFHRSDELGANAFTLPDRTIILLDGFITTLGDDRGDDRGNDREIQSLGEFR